jgi:dTDP-4-amino-4,6-dideoxygalactose transaminase
LLDRGIGAGIHYPTPVHRTAAFAGVAGSNLSVSERAAGEILSLPLFPHITEEQQVRVVDALGEVLRTS